MKQGSKYFNNELPEQEDEEITKKLLQNHYDNQSKEKWRQILASKHKVLPPGKRKIVKTNLFLKIGLIAASILVLIFAGKLYTDFSNQNSTPLNTHQLLSSHLAEKYDHPSLKKGPKEDNIRTEAINAYTIGNYKKSISSYEQIPNLKGEDFVYLGLSFLYSEQAERAIPLFQKAIEMVPFDSFRSPEEIRWQLSLAYLKNNQIDMARIELERLANNKSGKRRKDAKEILDSF